MRRLLFELCAPSLAAAVAADRGGADRIELCKDLAVGGVTPDEDVISSVIQAVTLPVHVLIRPRAGDFVFSDEEFAVMQRQVEAAKAAGAAGIAVGVLQPGGRVDVQRSRALTELARPMQVTFHRAFDETIDLAEALEDVILTGADILLTSGGASDALTGARSIASLRVQAAGRIELMAGGGIRLENLGELLRRSGVNCVHGSLTRTQGATGDGITSLEGDVRRAMCLLRESQSPAEEPAQTAPVSN